MFSLSGAELSNLVVFYVSHIDLFANFHLFLPVIMNALHIYHAPGALQALINSHDPL